MDKENHPAGIYLLPNILTTVSLFSAFYSVVSSMKANYEAAVIAIFIGMIADCLDGRIARLTNTQTDFGAQYDSLSDMVTFGIAPSLLLYQMTLSQLGKFGWLVAFIYTACVALRLARFNTQLETADKRYFTGLPCPAAAGVAASFSWLCQQYSWGGTMVSYVTAIMVLLLAGLMVCNLRYYSFKEVDFKGKVPFLYVIIMIAIFVAVAAEPTIVLFAGFSGYALCGPLLTRYFVGKIRKDRARNDTLGAKD